jgi:hypothetical protein
MIDSVKNEPIEVSISGDLSYLVVPYEQLDKITALLDTNQVSYWVDEEVLSVDGGPEVAFINLRRGTDPGIVQRLLDSVP